MADYGLVIIHYKKYGFYEKNLNLHQIENKIFHQIFLSFPSELKLLLFKWKIYWERQKKNVFFSCFNFTENYLICVASNQGESIWLHKFFWNQFHDIQAVFP